MHKPKLRTESRAADPNAAPPGYSGGQPPRYPRILRSLRESYDATKVTVGAQSTAFDALAVATGDGLVRVYEYSTLLVTSVLSTPAIDTAGDTKAAATSLSLVTVPATSMVFAPNTPLLVVGDAQGRLSAFFVKVRPDTDTDTDCGPESDSDTDATPRANPARTRPLFPFPSVFVPTVASYSGVGIHVVRSTTRRTDPYASRAAIHTPIQSSTTHGERGHFGEAGAGSAAVSASESVQAGCCPENGGRGRARCRRGSRAGYAAHIRRHGGVRDGQGGNLRPVCCAW